MFRIARLWYTVRPVLLVGTVALAFGWLWWFRWPIQRIHEVIAAAVG